jgi:hypothetical protein
MREFRSKRLREKEEQYERDSSHRGDHHKPTKHLVIAENPLSCQGLSAIQWHGEPS